MKGFWSDWGKPCEIRTKPLLPPRNLEVEVDGCERIHVSWSKVQCAVSYRLEMKKETEQMFSEIYTGDSLEHTKSGLSPNTEYVFRVKTEFEREVSSPWSRKAAAKTKSNRIGLPSEYHWKECPGWVVEERKYSVDEMNPRIATKANSGSNCTVIGNEPLPQNRVISWNIKILKSLNNNGDGIWIGVAPSDINQNEGDNFKKCGWYFNCCNSTLYSGPPHNYEDKEYGPRKEVGNMSTQETVWVL